MKTALANLGRYSFPSAGQITVNGGKGDNVIVRYNGPLNDPNPNLDYTIQVVSQP